MISGEGAAKSVTLWSATERINIPVISSRTMPTNADECALDIPVADAIGVSVGDKVKIYADGSPEGFLRNNEFTVTALISYPQSISRTAAESVVVPASAFDAGKTADAFSGVLARFDIPEEIGMFSDDYLSRADKNISDLKPLLEDIAEKRTGSVKTKYNDEYEKAKKEADEKLGDAKKQLDDAENKMNEEFAKAESDLKDGEALAKTLKEELDKRIAEQEANPAAGGADVTAEDAEYDEMIRGLREGADDALKELENAKQLFEDKKAESIAKLEEKRKEYNEKREEAERELADAKQKIDDIKECSFIVQDRRMNESYEEMRNTLNSIGTVGAFFSPLFAVVGSIVFFSTIAIIIEEQKKQVGTVKALGFRNGKIRSKYLLFGLSAAVIGSLLGIVLSVLLEKLVLARLEPRYIFDEIPVVVSAPIALIFCSVTLVTVYVVVWAACSHLLKCSAVGLINGSEPQQKSKKKKKNKERRSSLYSTLILNNVLTDATRVIVGITVIAASGLLIGAGVTLRQSFSEAFTQEEQTWLYDLKVVVNDGLPDAAKQEIDDILTSSGAEYAPAYSGGIIYETKDGGAATQLVIMDKDSISKFINVGESGASGLAVSRNLADAHGLDKGSELTIYGQKFETVRAPVSGTFVLCIGNMMTITQQEYEKLFGYEFDDNCYYVKCSDADTLAKKLSETGRSYSGYVVTEESGIINSKTQTIKVLFDLVAAIFIILAAVLNFLIMINLTNILVNRRMKEILVMRVNGFSMKQAIGYLARESAFSTIVGIIVGVGVGIPFSKLLIRSISNTSITLSDQIVPIAWIISVVLGIIFALVINAISFRKVKKASLVNISQY